MFLLPMWFVQGPCCCGQQKVTMSTYQCIACFRICDLNLELIEKFQANDCRLPHWKKTVTWKFPEIRPEIFGQMVSAQDSFFTIFASSP